MIFITGNVRDMIPEWGMLHRPQSDFYLASGAGVRSGQDHLGRGQILDADVISFLSATESAVAIIGEEPPPRSAP